MNIDTITYGYVIDHITTGNAIKIWVDIDALELKNDNVPVDYKIQINVSDFLKQMTLLARMRR